jgi:Ca-activated chloride channel family protein
MSKNRVLKILFSTLILVTSSQAFAFSWQDLWATPDQQAQTLMKKEQFTNAQSLFQNKAWRASAAYRSKDYQQAATGFSELSTELGYYNQGNALAQLGKYAEAIAAYKKVLTSNPSNQDALYNLKLVESLLKKEQDKKPSDKEKSQQNNQDKSTQKFSNENSENDPQKDSPKDQQTPSPSQQEQKPSAEEQKNNETPSSDKKDKKPDVRKKPPMEKPSEQQTSAESEKQSAQAREKQQANDQWLRLIPDDPGGLMREKFRRDYLRRQKGSDS